LRQNKPLTPDDQENYFSNVVSKLFNEDQPNQILFSFLEDNICVGYGGLVHINWESRNAEISFLMKTELEDTYFEYFWSIYLRLIAQVSFNEIGLHKIYTYAYDLRPHLYKVLEKNKFIQEAKLKEHFFFNGKYRDVVIHSKIVDK
jgi:RimJ/RimL family protein N-acetyltransferase